MGAGEPSRMQVAVGREVRPALGVRRRRVSGWLRKAESARIGACASVLRGPDPPGERRLQSSHRRLARSPAEHSGSVKAVGECPAFPVRALREFTD